MKLQPNDTVGKYQIIKSAGGGSFGDVYAVRNTNLDAKRAVKFVKATGASDVQKLLAEAKLLHAAANKHIVEVFDANVLAIGGEDFVAIEMEYLPDGSIQDRASAGITITDALRASRHFLFGLISAHSAGVIHRDIKPGNILIDGNDYKLSDFGIAYLKAAVGTYEHIAYPMCAAPECLSGKIATEQSDIYSAGVTIYRLMLLRGDLKISKVDFEAWRKGGCLTGLPEYLGFPSYWPLRLKRIVLRATQPLAGGRYSSAHEMLTDVDRLKTGLPWAIDSTNRWMASAAGRVHEAWIGKSKAGYEFLYKINGRKPPRFAGYVGSESKAQKLMEQHVAKTSIA